MTKLPDFKTLDEEADDWESHDSAEFWQDMEKVSFTVNLHRNLLHPKLVILAHRPDYCPRCQHAIEDIVITYMALEHEELLVIRDVPALLCRSNGHEYILETTLAKVELLLELKNRKQLQPTETLTVPVYSLTSSTPATVDYR